MYLARSPFIVGIDYLRCYDNIELQDEEVQDSKEALLKQTLQCDKLLVNLILISVGILTLGLIVFTILVPVLKFNTMTVTLIITVVCIISHIGLIVIDTRVKRYEKKLVLTYKRAKRLYKRFGCYYFDDPELYRDNYYLTLEKFLFNNSETM